MYFLKETETDVGFRFFTTNRTENRYRFFLETLPDNNDFFSLLRSNSYIPSWMKWSSGWIRARLSDCHEIESSVGKNEKSFLSKFLEFKNKKKFKKSRNNRKIQFLFFIFFSSYRCHTGNFTVTIQVILYLYSTGKTRIACILPVSYGNFFWVCAISKWILKNMQFAVSRQEQF
jgi:hypothetical protein